MMALLNVSYLFDVAGFEVLNVQVYAAVSTGK
jgi:hypothetical protein